MSAIIWPSPKSDARAYAIAAAGLLHDIGKLLEPAEIELSQQTRNLEQMFCPTDPQSRRHTHRHVLYSSHAFEQLKTNFGGLDRQLVHDIAMHHHKPSPNRLEQQILTRADWTASGNDRLYVAKADEEQVNGMLSVLSMISWPHPTPTMVSEERWLPTVAMTFGDEQLPRAKPPRDRYKQQCAALVDPLLQRLSTDVQSSEEWIHTAMTALECCLHAVPASRYRKHQPDVSLFDHSRTVAAFGACLAIQVRENNLDAHALQGRYRLVAIAAGGVQRFLFRKVPGLETGPGDTGEKGTGKQLRARSLYVSLLVRLAAQRILNSTGLPPVNLMLDAGGRCVLLLPDTSEVIEITRRTIDAVDQWIAQHLSGVLRLDFAISEPLTDSDFQQKDQRFAQTYRDLDERLAKSRFRFPFPALRDMESWTDSKWVSRRSHGDIEDRVSLTVDRKSFTESLVRFGQQLPKADLITIDTDPKEHALREAWLDILGYRVSLHNRRPDTGQAFALRNFDGHPDLPAMITATWVPQVTTANLPRLSELPTGVYSESNDRSLGQLLTFEELAHLSVDDEGQPIRHPMLAALKADVDRLGMIIGYGLDDRVSFGRCASLSRQLDLFFKGFLTRRLEQQFPHIYTVFAGGDDLFLIGPWYDVMRFVGRLQRWFRQLVSCNPNLTYSAGVVFSVAGTPVRHLAEHADRALEQAKDAGRDRISIGPFPVTWDDYFRAEALHHQMLHAARASSGQFNTSLAYRLLQYARTGLGLLPGRSAGERNPLDLKWRSQLNYDLKRNLPLRQSDPADPVNKLRTSLIDLTTELDLKVLHIASTLTLYVLRGNQR